MTPASNVPVTLSLHFINQSYNAGCNYFNRSGSDLNMKEMGIEDIFLFVCLFAC